MGDHHRLVLVLGQCRLVGGAEIVAMSEGELGALRGFLLQDRRSLVVAQARNTGPHPNHQE